MATFFRDVLGLEAASIRVASLGRLGCPGRRSASRAARMSRNGVLRSYT
jgi:hypothetical protein